MDLHVSGAYGRDYKSSKSIKEDWEANKDFIVRNPGFGKYVSKQEAEQEGIEVWGRYDKDRKIIKLQDGK